ncbi:hypothetical protein D9611_004322 [Ephemerocybe angulata]|uniref:Uncharacterized protein n=1 Tax=Ephemerocybe angulata TaxID=980116 RepID=A0A8H5F5W2_9AGAR|nr:hypothetical protein D9611_004322 [Tulosesus angulatus]
MPRTVQIIRDAISITSNFPYIAGLKRGDTLRLIARQVTLPATYNLKGVNLEIYAVEYNISNNAVLYNHGPSGANGGDGANGRRDAIQGLEGGQGVDGLRGGEVKVVAEVVSGRWQVDVGGGDGGNGGSGGRGHDIGVEDVWPIPLGRTPYPFPPYIEKTGGKGGNGGKGGLGGHGGIVILASVTSPSDVVPGTLLNGGSLGKGGGGGAPGQNGWPKYKVRSPIALAVEGAANPEIRQGPPGKGGDRGGDGADGSSGELKTTTLSYAEFWASLASEPFAFEWAKYRHAVGEFYFRSYVPGAADRDHYVGLAVDEFQAAIRLNAGQTESILRLEHIWNDINPLGLPRNFDVIPNFKEYITNLTNLGSLVATFSSIGNTTLLKATDLQGFQEVFKGQRAQCDVRIEDATANLEISKQTEKDLGEALKELEGIMEEVKRQIEAANEEMKKPLSIGGIGGSVKDIAVAVVAVIAAVPTGGASLIAIVPSVISLGKTIYDNAAPMVKVIVDDMEDGTRQAVLDKHNKVKKDASGILDKSERKVTNLQNIIAVIKRARTADNGTLMDLLLKGAELVYEHLLKQQELKRAQMKTRALEQNLVSERALRAFHEASIARTGLTEEIVREAGLKVIQAAFSKVDILLGFAFRAQRSVEIYLLKDQTQHVLYDIGRVHPDLEADYLFDPSTHVTTLATSYQKSFTRLLDPAEMWKTYQTYFERPLLKDIRRLAFTDPVDLETFRSTFTLTFMFDAATLAQQRYRTKIQAVGISFVGATGEGNLVSCKLEHSGVYSERMSNGTIHHTILQARREVIPATITPLHTNGLDLDSSPPLDGPRSSPLWAMGIGGLYTITIPKSEFEDHHPTFDGLKKIEVWFGYQFMERE